MMHLTHEMIFHYIQAMKASAHTLTLDKIQESVFDLLKPTGFKKKGRTFNREAEKGIYQVINFQSGEFPLSDKYVVPGLRENLYGKFTVNMGVCVETLINYQSHGKIKPFYKEYECQIRRRLAALTKGKDFWWSTSDDIENISEEIIDGFKKHGFEWFGLFDTKEKIIANWGNDKYARSPRAKLDVALLLLSSDWERGAELFNAYYNGIKIDGHKKYVFELAKEIGVTLKDN